jgi:DNA gyrase subunit A
MDGTIKRLDQFSGRGSARETPRRYLTCNTRDVLLLFTAGGSCYGVPVHKIPPAAKRSEHGVAIASLVDLDAKDEVVAIAASGPAQPEWLLFATEHGLIKRTLAAEYAHARRVALPALRLETGDRLVSVEAAESDVEILLHTSAGKVIRFAAADVRPTGRTAGGVRAIKLETGDRVTPGTLTVRGIAVLTLTAAGIARRAPIADYPLQGRDGAGVRAIALSDKTGSLVTAFCVDERATVEGLDGAGRAFVVEAKEVPMQDRRRAGLVIAEGITAAVLLPTR